MADTAFLLVIQRSNLLQSLIMKKRTFLQTFMELYRDQLSEKVTKLTIFFFTGSIVAAILLINLKIIRHSPLQPLLSNTGGVINVFMFTALLFVLEVLLIIMES